jgi:RNA-binding protein 15
LHSKASDDVVRDTLYREYKKYGDISVRVIIEPDERVAYVYFRNFDDAEDALYSKSRIILFDRPAVVEPVFESRSEPRRPRSITPPPSYSRYRSRSPVPRNDHYYKEYKDYKEYRGDDYHHHHHAPKPYYSNRGHHDYPPHRGEYHHRGYRGRGNYHGERGRGGYHRGRGGGEGGSRHFEPRGDYKADYKKEKFPNYLTHIPPEDDPLATRTLFAGKTWIHDSLPHAALTGYEGSKFYILALIFLTFVCII